MSNLVTANPTMTSLELVKFINDSRKTGEAELLHRNFMAKVDTVLGGGALIFKHTQTNSQNGMTYPIYTFPKREACLMAMSYSYELQAKVFDRMTAEEARNSDLTLRLAEQSLKAAQLQLEVALAETESARQRATQDTMAESARVFQAHQALMLTKNPDTPSHLLQTEAAKQVLQQTGVNLSRPMTNSPAMDSVAEVWLSPSQMGKLLGYRNTDYRALGLAVNLQLNKLGLQRLSATSEECQLGKYCPTEVGQKYTNIHAWLSDMTTGFNLKWSPSVLNAFRFPRINEFSEAAQYDPSTDGENEAWFYEHAAMVVNLSAPVPAGRWSHLH